MKGKQADLTESEQLAEKNKEAVNVGEKDKAVEKAIERTDLSLYTDFPGINAQKMNIIRNTICKGLDFLETCFFLNHASNVKLNPFNKEIWAWKDRHGKIVSTASEAGYRVNAERHPDYAGIKFGVIFEGDNFKFNFVDPDKVVHERDAIKTGTPIGAWAIAYRKGLPPIGAVSNFLEYSKTGSNSWINNPSDMIAKVARTKALSVQFPISGVIPEFEVVTKDGLPDYLNHTKGEESQEELAEELFNNKVGEALELWEVYEGKDKERIGETIRLMQKEKTLTIETLDHYIEHMQTNKA